jgi:hypothetical protein
MNRALPSEIQVSELNGGVQYLLPRRSRGGSILGQMVGLSIGAVILGGCLFYLGALGPPVVVWVIILLGMAFLYFMLVIHLFARSEIRLQEGYLHAIERIGPFRQARKRPLDCLRRLAVTDPPHAGANWHGGKAPDRAAVIVAQCEGASPLEIARSYPRHWLLALADDLARRCNLATAEKSPEALPGPVEVVLESADLTADHFHQPLESKIVLQETAEGLTLTIPAIGTTGGGKGLLSHSLGRFAFMTLFAGFWVWLSISERDMPWFLAAIAGFFWVIGLIHFLMILNLVWRHAVVSVVGDQLTVTQSGPFATSVREWTLEQLAGIRPAPSNVLAGDKQGTELQLHLKKGEKVSLFAGRDRAELQWLATVLRQALGLTRQSLRDRLEQPTGSVVQVDRDSGGVTLTIPAVGVWRVIATWLVSRIFFYGVAALLALAGWDFWKGFPLLPRPWSTWILFGLMILFGLISLVSAINAGCRRVVLAVAGDDLLILQTGLFGTRAWEWSSGQLADIGTPSPEPGANRPLRMRLEVHSNDGTMMSFLPGRDETELQWLATELRHALRLPLSDEGG